MAAAGTRVKDETMLARRRRLILVTNEKSGLRIFEALLNVSQLVGVDI